jgi:hypothetical protein
MNSAEDSPVPGLEDLEPFAWPERHHDLRAVGTDWTSHAMVGRRYSNPTLRRVVGFRRAAELLADHVLAHRGDLDSVFFPLASCWRHYVELRLKTLLVDLRRLLDLPVKQEHHHDIQQLWAEVRPLLVRADPGEERRHRSIVGRCLRQLAEIDPDDQSFRYGQRKDRTTTLEGIERIDVRRFHDALLATANYLDAAAEHTIYVQDIKDGGTP